MTRFFLSVLLVFVCLPVHADDVLAVKIGATDIRLSCPPGMADIPKDNPLFHVIGDLTPDGCVLLRNCISSEALDTKKAPDPAEDILLSGTFALKDVLRDIDSGDFIDFVQAEARQASHGVLMPQDSPFDYVESQKRLDQFQKDTGVGVEDASDVYSLGMVSRSYACVSYMEAQYVNMTADGKTVRRKNVSIIAYLLLKKKVVLVITSLTKDTVLHDDLGILMEAAEKYQLDLQVLNNT